MPMTIEEYHARNAELTRHGMQQMAEQGLLPGCAPVGYKNAVVNGIKTIIVDENMAPLIQEAFIKAIEGKSLRTILRELTPRGLQSRNGKLMGVSSLAKVLKNPFYMGIIEYMGEVVPGKHKPLIDKTLFLRVRDHLERRQRH